MWLFLRVFLSHSQQPQLSPSGPAQKRLHLVFHCAQTKDHFQLWGKTYDKQPAHTSLQSGLFSTFTLAIFTGIHVSKQIKSEPLQDEFLLMNTSPAFPYFSKSFPFLLRDVWRNTAHKSCLHLMKLSSPVFLKFFCSVFQNFFCILVWGHGKGLLLDLHRNNFWKYPRDQRGCWKSNPGQLHAKQVPYLLYSHSSFVLHWTIGLWHICSYWLQWLMLP